jgi:hypothetical protein
MQKNITQTWIVVGSILLSVIITYADNHPESTEEKNLEGSVSVELEDGRISSVNSRRITINLGREDGVKRGMTLEIYRSKTLYNANTNQTQTIKEPLGIGLVVDVSRNHSILYLSNFEVKTANRDKMSPPLIDIGTNIRLVRIPANNALALGRHSILVRKFEGTGSDIEERLAEAETDQLAASIDNGPQVPFKSDQEIELIDPENNKISVVFGKNAAEGIASFKLIYKVDKEIVIIPGIESKPLPVVEIYDRVKRPPQDLIESLQQIPLGEGIIAGIKDDVVQLAGISREIVENGDQLTLIKMPKEIIHPVTNEVIILGIKRQAKGLVSVVSDNLIQLNVPVESTKGFFTDDTVSVIKE